MKKKGKGYDDKVNSLVFLVTPHVKSCKYLSSFFYILKFVMLHCISYDKGAE